jgi:hypothetical protein
MKFRLFWGVLPCSQVDVDRRFRGAYCFHHQGYGRPDDGGSPHLWNVGQHLLDYTAVHPRILYTSRWSEFALVLFDVRYRVNILERFVNPNPYLQQSSETKAVTRSVPMTVRVKPRIHDASWLAGINCRDARAGVSKLRHVKLSSELRLPLF